MVQTKEPQHYVPKIFGFKICAKHGSKFEKKSNNDAK